jgi:hypothetical protein
MAVIEMSRKIRPSSHSESDPYRVKCEKVSKGDTLQINITHESDSSVDMLFQIGYSELKGKNSIHFKAHGKQIEWLDGIKLRQIR